MDRVTAVPDSGLMIAGHVLRPEALEIANEWLTEQGVDEFTREEWLEIRKGLVARAWWGGEAVGFVPEGYEPPGGGPAAEACTVVHIPLP